MSVIREEFVHAAIARLHALIDYNVHNDIHKQYEFKKQTVLADNSFTEDEKTFAINRMTKDYDYYKILNNSGTKRICENCKQECLATLYSNWINGNYEEWDSKNQQLKRFGIYKVILKSLENVESANQSWFEEAKSHLTIGNKFTEIVQCFGTPAEYKNLMEQCWDADPSKRPDIITLDKKMTKINLFYQSSPDESFQSEIYRNLEQDKTNSSTNSRLFTSKIHQFENLSEPRNATEEELEAFHSNKSYDFNIPNNIDDFNKSSNQNSRTSSKLNSIFKAGSKKLSKVFKKLQIKDETIQQTKGPNIANFNDEDDTYNNPNLHSEEQNELEIPDDLN
ncbi:kinase-like domain-containing protein [Rhizophagus irregularis DAOM 181602=DAOM 197198]|nr:kinase-like domain-containing protein [Rhizophagus irregularis DAOM 181602=DAOM 197198]